MLFLFPVILLLAAARWREQGEGKLQSPEPLGPLHSTDDPAGSADQSKTSDQYYTSVLSVYFNCLNYTSILFITSWQGDEPCNSLPLHSHPPQPFSQ